MEESILSSVYMYRVDYRISLMAARKQQLAEREEEELLERQKMEDRLEQLRSTVRKEASFDLHRTFGDTEVSHLVMAPATVFTYRCQFQQASRARTRVGHAEELDLQQPLFLLHGFTDEEVVGGISNTGPYGYSTYIPFRLPQTSVFV